MNKVLEPAIAKESTPGRACPLSYRYSPAVFREAQPLAAETLYVIGGLYGNRDALAAILERASREPRRPVLVFNGDFNWFETQPDAFSALNDAVLAHVALRGNVETELAGDDDAAGCGCGYPHWVGDAEVERSNAIMRILRGTARLFPALRARLASAPMWLAAEVADVRVGIVHGDAWALAGWAFSQEHLRDSSAALDEALRESGVDLFASSHTCLPVMRERVLDGRRRALANNGTAGMPNFRGTTFGLITRIASEPAGDALYGTRLGRAFVEALPVHYDTARWLERFDALWPAGSPASISYRNRISEGAAYDVASAFRPARAG